MEDKPSLTDQNKGESKKDAKATDGNNEASLVSFSSKSSSDSDDLDKMDDQMPRRGKKGSHKRHRERDGEGDQGKNAFGEDETPRVKRENSVADGGPRRAYDNSPTSGVEAKRGVNRSRSRSNSPRADRGRANRDDMRRAHHRALSQDS